MNQIGSKPRGTATKKAGRDVKALRRLACLCGVQTAYVDNDDRRRVARPDALVAVLGALGETIERPADAPEALRRREAEGPPGMPSAVAWNGRAKIDVPAPLADASANRLTLHTEDGATIPLTVRRWEDRDGRRRLIVSERVPYGVHAVAVGAAGRLAITLFSAPARCRPVIPPDAPARHLGCFLPLYALRRDDGWGVGDLTDLHRLAAWARASGCRWLGTLPLLPCFLDEPFEPSPYSPMSRLFWNELFADVTTAPELELSAELREMLASDTLRRQVASLSSDNLVDYRGTMAAKRRVLDRLAAAAFANDAVRAELDRFIATRPALDDYATFRAAVERSGRTWMEWSGSARDGSLTEDDFDDRVRRVHVYAQWLVHRQLERMTRDDDAADLYLDLPIGVSGGGYDVWRHRRQFATSVSVGAPPDPFFKDGQNWGFPPPHPWNATESGHGCFRASIRHHLEHAKLLRIDHVMGLHRLYWIPRGFDATEGVYVRYPASELHATLAIESHRANAAIVGENLGTVPAEVNRQMRRRGMLGMYVAQFGLRPDPKLALRPVTASTLASLNTHDMPPFAAFWSGEELELRRRLDLIDPDEMADERRARGRLRAAVITYLRTRGRLTEKTDDASGVLQALLEELAVGDAEIVLVNLEDLWLEQAPQNVPGVTDAYPSWRRIAARSLEQILGDETLAATLHRLAELRDRSAPGSSVETDDDATCGPRDQ